MMNELDRDYRLGAIWAKAMFTLAFIAALEILALIGLSIVVLGMWIVG